MNMKFIKGMIIGSIASFGAIYMYNEMSGSSKKQIVKTGKKIAKKIGII